MLLECCAPIHYGNGVNDKPLGRGNSIRAAGDIYRAVLHFQRTRQMFGLAGALTLPTAATEISAN